MAAQTSGPSLDTWIQAAAALFTAIAAGAAWAATRQVKAGNEEERQDRIMAHLKTIHRLVSDLALANPNDPRVWQPPQLNLRAEVTAVFHPLPKCGTLADANLWEADEPTYENLVRDAMAEVEAAQRTIWLNSRRRRWFSRRQTTDQGDTGVSESV